MLPPYDNERERLRDDAPDLKRYVEEGTVGWTDDKDSISHGNDFDDGNTLVKVTLFDGHPVGEPTTADGSANGHRILARITGPFWETPKRGSRVVVLFPGGRIDRPGNGVIAAAPGPSPKTRFGRDKTVIGDPDKDITIVGRSVSLEAKSTDQSGASHYHVVVVSSQGAQVLADGSGLQMFGGKIALKTIDDNGNIKTSISLSQTELSLMDATALPTTASVTLKSGNVTMIGQFVSVIPGTAMKIGTLASPATPILLGPTGPTAVPSTFIWGAVAPT